MPIMFRPSVRRTGCARLPQEPDFGSQRPEELPQTYEESKSQCLQGGSLWEDPDFPTVTSSLYKNPPCALPNIEWKRPREICSNPQLFVDGASRMDVVQGKLDDCWLLAALASLTTNQTLLHQVVPPDQSFDKEYTGVFRFQFWQYGRWVEVLVDDRLPTEDNKLIYMHSKERNEFWSALLEKAFAKLNGSYQALNCGLAGEALTDFTGGVVERYELKSNAPCNLFQIMLKAQKKGSLMGCFITESEAKMGTKLSNGLIIGHAYSITDVRTVQTSQASEKVQTSQASEKVQMVRVRNPWADSNEWKGAWSDGSKEWQTVSTEEKRNLGLTFEHDGEFWMSFKDFVSNYDRLEICFLGPDSLTDIEVQKGTRKWEGCLFEGAWHRRVNAGGCRNYPSTFWTNPQYRVKISDPDSDDEDGNGSMIIGLMQKQRRWMRKEGAGNLNIGYTVFKAPKSEAGTINIFGKNFFNEQHVCARSKEFTDLREVSCHHKLSPGEYVIVPSTYDPNEEGDFILRIFSERKNDQAGEVDCVTTCIDIKKDILGVKDPMDKVKKEMSCQTFLAMAGEDGQIDAFELRDILNSTFKKDFDFSGFSKDMTRIMVAMGDDDNSGKLGFEEFKKLWAEIMKCKRTFKMMDADGNGYFNSREFRNALNALGFRVNNATFKTIVIRHSNREGHVRFDDFVNCYFELKAQFEKCQALEMAGYGEKGKMEEQNQEGPEVVKKADVTGCRPRWCRPRCFRPCNPCGYRPYGNFNHNSVTNTNIIYGNNYGNITNVTSFR